MNTRFNPTANGHLHIGHLYLALVNYHEAKAFGGRFVLRFDDDQDYWLSMHGAAAVDGFCEAMIEDLQWVEIVPDLISWENRERAANEAFIKQHMPCPARPTGFPQPIWAGCDQPYPYVPYLTAIKVVQDHREGCDLLIRGEELATEFSLYHYFCGLLGLAPPKFVYLPRMRRGSSPLADISKRSGGFSIREYRERGYDPSEVIGDLAECCLTDPDRGWFADNVKLRPSISPTCVRVG